MLTETITCAWCEQEIFNDFVMCLNGELIEVPTLFCSDCNAIFDRKPETPKPLVK